VVDLLEAMRVLLVEDLGLAIKQVLVSEKYVVDWVLLGSKRRTD
jgi:two-component system, OmpR family, Ni(II)-responsive and/or redox-responsive regulator NrsR